MPFVPVVNTVMVEWRATRNSQNIENRIMVDVLTAPTSSIMQDVAVTCWDWWQNTHSGHLSAEVALREVVVTDISQVNGGQFTYAPSSGVVGAISGTALPNEVAFCVSLRSAFRGRSARGRFYTMSVNQTQMADSNFLTTGAAGDFVQDLNTLRVTLDNAGYNFVIVSYRLNNAPRPGGPVKFTVQTATAVDNAVDSMKRRKPGVGA